MTLLSPALQARIDTIAERIDALTLRERALVFIGVMAAVFIVALNLLFTPLRAEHGRLEAAVRAKNEQVQALNQQIEILAGASTTDLDGPQRERIVALERELAALDQQLEQITGGTVSPRQMARLLEQLLSRHGAVQLVRVESLPSVPAVDAQVPTGAGASRPAIYKHGVRLELRGRYFDIVEYLKAVEALPWKMFWGQVTLESDHPASKVTLVVYTLSRHSAWVGI